jgi:hypothetical protein
MDMVQLMPILLEVGRKTVECAGGPDMWNGLSKEEQDACMHKSRGEMYRERGQKQFETLSEVEKRSVNLFLWAGCCMHKELNSVKGGNVRMMAWWGENEVIGPIKLMNRDNAAAAIAGCNGPGYKSVTPWGQWYVTVWPVTYFDPPVVSALVAYRIGLTLLVPCGLRDSPVTPVTFF